MAQSWVVPIIQFTRPPERQGRRRPRQRRQTERRRRSCILQSWATCSIIRPERRTSRSGTSIMGCASRGFCSDVLSALRPGEFWARG
jgi:hypothetical protein